jgi:hypothetical protein
VDLQTLTVLWMDDRQETYENTTHSVREGVLHISVYAEKTHSIIREWHWPISNIRGWYPASQDPPSWLKG